MARYRAGECITCGHNHSVTTSTTTTTTSTTTTTTTTILPQTNNDDDFIFEPNVFDNDDNGLEFNSIFHLDDDDSHNTTDNEY